MGWYPELVKLLACELGDMIPSLHNGPHTCEEKMLCVLARFKLGVASWGLLGFHFQRAKSVLCDMFTEAVKVILGQFEHLVSVEGLSRIPPEYVAEAQEKLLKKYRAFVKDPRAEFPGRFHQRIDGWKSFSHLPPWRR